MSKNKKIVLNICAALLVIIVGICVLAYPKTAAADELIATEPTVQIEQPDPAKVELANKDGYTDVSKWETKLEQVKTKSLENIKEQQKTYKKHLTKKQKNKVVEYKKKIKEATTITKIKKINVKLKAIYKKAKKAKSFYDKSSHRRTITRSGGVYYYGGRTETYYSSRVLYHYKTPQWVCDNEGFWRTKEGYYVVACSDKSYGTIFRGSKGLCKVLDSGCAAGITDYYVNW